MTLEKAIKILKRHQLPTEWDLYDVDVDAIKLGIEALEAIQMWRKHALYGQFSKLPGETGP